MMPLAMVGSPLTSCLPPQSTGEITLATPGCSSNQYVFTTGDKATVCETRQLITVQVACCVAMYLLKQSRRTDSAEMQIPFHGLLFSVVLFGINKGEILPKIGQHVKI